MLLNGTNIAVSGVDPECQIVLIQRKWDHLLTTEALAKVPKDH